MSCHSCRELIIHLLSPLQKLEDPVAWTTPGRVVCHVPGTSGGGQGASDGQGSTSFANDPWPLSYTLPIPFHLWFTTSPRTSPPLKLTTVDYISGFWYVTMSLVLGYSFNFPSYFNRHFWCQSNLSHLVYMYTMYIMYSSYNWNQIIFSSKFSCWSENHDLLYLMFFHNCQLMLCTVGSRLYYQCITHVELILIILMLCDYLTKFNIICC